MKNTKRLGVVLPVCLLLLLAPLPACSGGGQAGATSSVMETTASVITSSQSTTTAEITTTSAETTTTETPVSTTTPPPLKPGELPPVEHSIFSYDDYGYEITFPESWTGRFGISVNKNYVTFYQLASSGVEYFPNGYIICHICVFPLTDEFKNMAAGETFSGKDDGFGESLLLAKNENYAIVVRYPVGIEFPFPVMTMEGGVTGEYVGRDYESFGREFNAMQEDVRQLRLSVRTFPPQS